MSSSSAAHRVARRRPRRFAPLNPDVHVPDGKKLPRLKGVVFDMDGTLCLPQNYMFRQMRTALSIPKSVDILDHIHSLSTVPDSPSSDTSPQQRARLAIEAIERNAMTSQTPQPGLLELMTYLDKHGLPKALCTRNFPLPVVHLLETFLPDTKFEPIITRETEGIAPKPSPAGLWFIAERWGVSTKEAVNGIDQEVGEQEETDDPLELAKRYLGSGMIMVGDSTDDISAGFRSGAATVLLLNEDNGHVAEKDPRPDLVIERLDELIEVLDRGFVGRGEEG